MVPQKGLASQGRVWPSPKISRSPGPDCHTFLGRSPDQVPTMQDRAVSSTMSPGFQSVPPNPAPAHLPATMCCSTHCCLQKASTTNDLHTAAQRAVWDCLVQHSLDACLEAGSSPRRQCPSQLPSNVGNLLRHYAQTKFVPFLSPHDSPLTAVKV